MWQLRVRDHISATMSVLFVLLFSFAVADAKGPGQLPYVMVLATGGTIAGTGASSTTVVGYTAATVGIERLLNAVPELKTVANVKGEQVFQIASENMNNDYWLKLAKHVNALLARDDVDGIVITHGTDTIEETSYFLNLVVKSKKPVVIVGAMRPSTAISADGPINLFNAVILAGSDEAVGKGVLVALNDQINAACSRMYLESISRPICGSGESMYFSLTRSRFSSDSPPAPALPKTMAVHSTAAMTRLCGTGKVPADPSPMACTLYVKRTTGQIIWRHLNHGARPPTGGDTGGRPAARGRMRP